MPVAVFFIAILFLLRSTTAIRCALLHAAASSSNRSFLDSLACSFSVFGLGSLAVQLQPQLDRRHPNDEMYVLGRDMTRSWGLLDDPGAEDGLG